MYKKVSYALLVSSMLALHTSAQSVSPTEKTVRSLVFQHAAELNLSAGDVKNMRIASFYYDEAAKVTMVYLQQTHKGVDVQNAIMPVAFKEGKAVTAASLRSAAGGEVVGDKSAKPAVSAVAALRTAVAALNLPLQQAPVQLSVSGDKQEYEFSNAGISYNNILVHLLWAPAEAGGQYNLTWQVNLQSAKKNENWLVKIDAQKGNVIKKENVTVSETITQASAASKHYTAQPVAEGATGVESVDAISSASYKVIPYPYSDPDHKAPTVVTNPWTAFGAGNLATSLKWNNDGSKDYDSTRGNNVYAQPDLDGKNATQNNAARSTTALPNLTFNFTPDFNVDPLKSTANRNFAITNLFYWNNIMHDMSYQYGFNEVAGNYQQNNGNRGGKGADYVIADGMDGGGTNNANFSTPLKDGTKPRMQMYLWSPSPYKIKVLKINAPSSYAGFKMSSESAFSTKNKLAKVGPVTANVVYFNNNGAPASHTACVAAGNASALSGKIAYIDRGDCAFTDKVLKAQNAGAVGVIVGDNVVADIPLAMGGTNNTIVIPAVSITLKDADSLKSFLDAGLVVNATLQADTTTPQLDGDLDNGIIVHEYMHGISSRLTGGPNKSSYCLQNKEQMGEGWSDYMALMMTTDWTTATPTDGALPHAIGNYAAGLPTTGAGIRIYPYSTDMAINPWTYDSLAKSSYMTEVHNIGEPWCEMLWDMTWNLINTAGINRNFYNANGAGGNSVAVKLVLQGLKLQPCAVGFVSGRNAILKADTLLYGGQYSPIIWQSFANRGCGYSAKEGKVTLVTDDTAAYDMPPGLLMASATAKTTAIANVAQSKKVVISPNPASDRLTISLPGNNKTLQVTLYTMGGQPVATYSFAGATKTIDVSKLAAGTYLVSITGGGVSFSEKVVIQ